MSIRWRLAILVLQLVALGVGTFLVTGAPLAFETWFFAGFLAVVVNPQLLEPWYPRPQDVLANSLIAVALMLTAPWETVAGGMLVAGVFVGASGVAALVGLVLGANRSDGRGATLGRFATAVSRGASALVIYSIVFWLSALEYRPELGSDLWLLGGTWALIVVLGRLNLRMVLSTLGGGQPPCEPQGMVGPATLLVSSLSLPAPGVPVTLRPPGGEPTTGVVLTRIRRSGDVWAAIHIDDPKRCEDLVRRLTLTVDFAADDGDGGFLGAVDAGSTDRELRFIATNPLQVGTVVAVREHEAQILYQIVSARVEEASVRGGSHLVVRALATQLGVYSRTQRRIARHAWVPAPGLAVRSVDDTRLGTRDDEGGQDSAALGTVAGTPFPVSLDLSLLSEGHLAILGMTRMGKTTLAIRLANRLAKTRPVTILDLTGQYVSREGMQRYEDTDENRECGLAVFEPPSGAVPADEAYKFLEALVDKAHDEYTQGAVRKQVLIIDEAHQFVPEPAGIGFNAPGRESAYKFGVLMMQVRKYGISVVLISQRTAVVGKSALSQCENLVAFKSVDQTGLDYLEAILGDGARNLLPSLEQGQAIVFGPAMSVDTPATVNVSH